MLTRVMPSEPKTASKVAVNLEADGADLITEFHQQIAGGLGGPGRDRVSGHPEDVHRAGADFHDEQDIDSAQRDRVEGGEQVGAHR
jgi:hypothetical protein